MKRKHSVEYVKEMIYQQTNCELESSKERYINYIIEHLKKLEESALNLGTAQNFLTSAIKFYNGTDNDKLKNFIVFTIVEVLKNNKL